MNCKYNQEWSKPTYFSRLASSGSGSELFCTCNIWSLLKRIISQSDCDAFECLWNRKIKLFTVRVTTSWTVTLQLKKVEVPPQTNLSYTINIQTIALCCNKTLIGQNKLEALGKNISYIKVAKLRICTRLWPGLKWDQKGGRGGTAYWKEGQKTVNPKNSSTMLYSNLLKRQTQKSFRPILTSSSWDGCTISTSRWIIRSSFSHCKSVCES